MRAMVLLAAVVLAGCAEGPSRYERLAVEICERQGLTRQSPEWTACFGPVYGGLVAGR
jgi:hypothetical protein